MGRKNHRHVKAAMAEGVTSTIGDGAGPKLKTGASYMRNNTGPFLSRWLPALRDSRDEVRQSWTLAVSRTIDALHNSGWLAGGVEQATSLTVGDGLRLSARPDPEVLGITADAASELARLIERRFETWASSPLECHAEARQDFGQQQRAAFKTWLGTGEIVAVLPYVQRTDFGVGTKVKLYPPHRLVQDSRPLENIFQGVRMDDYGMPVGYLFNFPSQVENSIIRKEIAARDGYGRPQVAHVFEGLPGDVRGITIFAPILQALRQYDQLGNATLMAALIQAIFAATIESQAPTADLLNALSTTDEQGTTGDIDAFMGARAGWYANTRIDLGEHGKIAHLFPNETLKFNKSEHPNGNYEQFAKFLLREIARCLGITYEQLTGDYTGATYSSVRMATSEIWQITAARRKNIAGRFCSIVYEAWLEEQIDKRLIDFPGGIENFLHNRAAACRAAWRGPPKPVADDLKTAKAHQLWKMMGSMSDEMVCAELGEDWEDVYEQQARELAARRRLKLPEPVYSQTVTIQEDLTTDDPPGEGVDNPGVTKPVKAPAK